MKSKSHPSSACIMCSLSSRRYPRRDCPARSPSSPVDLVGRHVEIEQPRIDVEHDRIAVAHDRAAGRPRPPRGRRAGRRCRRPCRSSARRRPAPCRSPLLEQLRAGSAACPTPASPARPRAGVGSTSTESALTSSSGSSIRSRGPRCPRRRPPGHGGAAARGRGAELDHRAVGSELAPQHRDPALRTTAAARAARSRRRRGPAAPRPSPERARR